MRADTSRKRPNSTGRRASLPQRLRRALALFDARVPLTLKLSVPILAFAVVGAFIVGFDLYRAEAGRIRDGFEERALLLGRIIEQDIASTAVGQGDEVFFQTVQSQIDSFVQLDDSIVLYNAYSVRDGDPALVASSDSDLIAKAWATQGDVDEDLHALYAADIYVHGETVGDQHALEVGVPLRIDGRPPTGLGLYVSTEERDRELAGLLQDFIRTMGVVLVLLPVLVLLLVRFLIFGRLRLLLAATRRMEEGDYGARVAGTLPEDARDDLVRLSARFNSMAKAIESLQGRLSKQATTDELTGLYNRRYILGALEREIARVRRGSEPLAAIMLDLDGLKTVNDRSGHPAGDNVLRQVSDAIRANVRAGDVAARFGGDEFVVLLPESDGDVLRSVMERIRRGAEGSDPVHLGGGETMSATVSAGGAVLRAEDDAATLLQRADTALLEAKRAGRNRVQVAA